MPSEDPVGCRKPSGNGFAKVACAVTKLSVDTGIGVDWLNPFTLKLGLATGNMNTPVPPRITVLEPKGVQANPKRGLNILDSEAKIAGLAALAKVGPPTTLNWLAGMTSGF